MSSGASPYDNFVRSSRICGWKEPVFNGEHSSKECYRPDTPKKELSSLVGCGRDGNQSGIGLANIELSSCKPLAQTCFVYHIRRHLESWYRPQRILVPSQH